MNDLTKTESERPPAAICKAYSPAASSGKNCHLMKRRVRFVGYSPAKGFFGGGRRRVGGLHNLASVRYAKFARYAKLALFAGLW